MRNRDLLAVFALESMDVVVTILLDYEHRFAEHEHEHEESRTVPLSRTLI